MQGQSSHVRESYETTGIRDNIGICTTQYLPSCRGSFLFIDPLLLIGKLPSPLGFSFLICEQGLKTFPSKVIVKSKINNMWQHLLLKLFFFFFGGAGGCRLHCKACRILVPLTRDGTHTPLPVVEAWSFNHWISREVPLKLLFTPNHLKIFWKFRFVIRED